MTGFNSQAGDGHYAIQFKTENRDCFHFVQFACQCAVDGRLPEAWEKMRMNQKELFALLDAGNCNDCAITQVCKFCPKPGEPVRANCPLYVPINGMKI